MTNWSTTSGIYQSVDRHTQNAHDTHAFNDQARTEHVIGKPAGGAANITSGRAAAMPRITVRDVVELERVQIDHPTENGGKRLLHRFVYEYSALLRKHAHRNCKSDANRRRFLLIVNAASSCQIINTLEC